MGTRYFGKSDIKKQPGNKQGRMMGIDYSPQHESDMDHNNPGRNLVIPLVPLRIMIDRTLIFRQQPGKGAPHSEQVNLLKTLIKSLFNQTVIKPASRKLRLIALFQPNSETAFDLFYSLVKMLFKRVDYLRTIVTSLKDIINLFIQFIVREKLFLQLILNILKNKFFLQPAQFAMENQEIETIGQQDTEQSFPTEICEHMQRAPLPGSGHHQNRRRSEISESSTDGNINEKQPDGSVLEISTGVEFIEFPGEQQSRNRHSRRLRNQRT